MIAEKRGWKTGFAVLAALRRLAYLFHPLFLYVTVISGSRSFVISTGGRSPEWRDLFFNMSKQNGVREPRKS